MKCIVCEEVCATYHPNKEGDLYPMISGTAFESTGNYGSTHWDCEGRKYLQIVICNDCLPKKADIIDVVSWSQPLVPRKELVSRVSYQEHLVIEEAENTAMNEAWEKQKSERAAKKEAKNEN